MSTRIVQFLGAEKRFHTAWVKRRHRPAPGPRLLSLGGLRDAQSLSGWWSSDQRCEPPQVLGNGSQNELILGASWTAQSKPAELQNALEVRKPHLDLLALKA